MPGWAGTDAELLLDACDAHVIEGLVLKRLNSVACVARWSGCAVQEPGEDVSHVAGDLGAGPGGVVGIGERGDCGPEAVAVLLGQVVGWRDSVPSSISKGVWA